ncbi:MAG: HlyD family efflux transporter periplasmic adaptor subunit [Rhizobiaceae bacterium]
MPSPHSAQTSDNGEKEFQFSAVNRTLAEPGSLLARGGVYFLAITLSGAVAWAATFEATDFVKAQAVVKPVKELPIVQSAYDGTVAAFDMRNGTKVLAGDTLLIIKSQKILEARRELTQRLREMEIAEDQLRATIETDIPALEKETNAKQHRIVLIEKLKSALADKRDASMEQIATEKNTFKSRIELANTQVEAFKKLQQKRIVSETKLREAKQTVLELTGQMASLLAGSRKAEVEFVEEERRLDLQISSLREELLQLDQRRRRSLREDKKRLVEAEIVLNRAKAAVRSIGTGLSRMATGDDIVEKQGDPTTFSIKAKADGTIIESIIVNTGQVIEAGKTLARIVPKDASLVVRVAVKNKDISSVNLDDEIRFKVAAYEYTKHGVLTGHVSRRSPASSENNKNGNFIAEVTLDQDYFKVKGEKKRLLPGMTGLVEIKTGKERLITRFFKPLKKIFEPEEAVH